MVLIVLSASPLYARSEAPVQEESALSLDAAEELAAECGMGFKPNPGKPMPTRAELQTGLDLIRDISVSSVIQSASDVALSSGSENRTCERRHGLFASMFQYLTLGTIRRGDACVELTRHDHEFREWNVDDRILDMWASHVDKDENPVGCRGWKVEIPYRLYRRFVG